MFLATSLTVQWFYMRLVMKIHLRGAQTCTSCTPGLQYTYGKYPAQKTSLPLLSDQCLLQDPCWCKPLAVSLSLTEQDAQKISKSCTEVNAKTKATKANGRNLEWKISGEQGLLLRNWNETVRTGKGKKNTFFFNRRFKGWVHVKWTAWLTINA